jgi:hypothetical protein
MEVGLAYLPTCLPLTHLALPFSLVHDVKRYAQCLFLSFFLLPFFLFVDIERFSLYYVSSLSVRSASESLIRYPESARALENVGRGQVNLVSIVTWTMDSFRQ